METPDIYSRRYDHAERRQSKRGGRERGAWIYVPAAELLAAGIDPNGPAPLYRTAGRQRSKNGHAVMVDLYAVAPAEPEDELAAYRNRLRAGAEILDSDSE